jgi:hypothetical protein
MSTTRGSVMTVWKRFRSEASHCHKCIRKEMADLVKFYNMNLAGKIVFYSIAVPLNIITMAVIIVVGMICHIFFVNKLAEVKV